MKKIITLLCVCALLLCCGCVSENKQQTAEVRPPAEEAAGLQVGFSRMLMNPTGSVPLTCYSNESNRYSREIGEDITCSAVYITDGAGAEVLLISADLANARETVLTPIRQQISNETGIPLDNIVISTIHSHSAAHYTGELPEATAYAGLIGEKLMAASVEAVNDRSAATMYIGQIETENLNFVRHYMVQDNLTEEVSMAGDNFGSFKDATIIGRPYEADPTLRMVQFTRASGEDVVLANWAAHPHFTGGATKYVLSSDYIAPFRDALEDMTGSHVVFFQGAAGEINETTRINEEKRAVEYRSYGALLADYANTCLKEHMKQAAADGVKAMQVDFQGTVNHSLEHLYIGAKAVHGLWYSTYSQADCQELMDTYGFRSIYQPLGIVNNHNRSDADCKISLKVISIGEELAILTFPGELFNVLYTQVEEQSPFAMTLLFGYADQHMGYLPTEAAYEYTCYETDVSRFAPENGQKVQQQYLEMLNSLSQG